MPNEKPYDPQPLEHAMKVLGYSNEKTAVLAGLSSTTLSQVRKGEEGVKVTTLRKVARALKLKVVITFEPASETETVGAR